MASVATLLDTTMAALETARRYAGQARGVLAERVAVDSGEGGLPAIDREQHIAHGYAWIETTIAALEAVQGWARARGDAGALDAVGQALVAIVFGEYCAQLAGGLPMAQNEFIRPADFGIDPQSLLGDKDFAALANGGNTASRRALVAEAVVAGEMPFAPVDDDLVGAIRDQFSRFTEQEILPHAHGWHLANALIPDPVIEAMAQLGTFGVCIPEEYGGLGLGKLVMCVVTEELSRGWIGTGSLGTRSEIAGELISLAGTAQQKAQWLPRIASGEVLPTAVFTEPDTGSDLGSLTTRAARDGEGWRIDGAKTWITHASRSDLMTLLARTDPDQPGYRGLSMLLVPKERGSEAEPFPDAGLSGGEIEVLGYRGMREYVLAFDGMRAPDDALLGGEEGEGFRQLMRTFEGARIQTAARAVGVARRALELGRDYAVARKQFGRPIAQFPRVADKLAMMAAETLAARELSYFAAREKDKGRRCDIEAGMAKLLAARVAWSNADAALQIHGGNGYAMEYEISRVLCDARILNIFEGAAEIQAQVIARGRLTRTN